MTAFKYLTTIFAKAVERTGQGTRDNLYLAYFLIFFDCLVLVGGCLVLIAIIFMLRLDIYNLKTAGRLDAEYDEETEYMVRKLRRISKKSGKKAGNIVPTHNLAYNMAAIVPAKKNKIKSGWDVMASDTMSTALAEMKVEKTEHASQEAHDTAIRLLQEKASKSHQRLNARLKSRKNTCKVNHQKQQAEEGEKKVKEKVIEVKEVKVKKHHNHKHNKEKSKKNKKKR